MKRMLSLAAAMVMVAGCQEAGKQAPDVKTAADSAAQTAGDEVTAGTLVTLKVPNMF